MAGRKYYVVWNGHRTGLFDSWEECRLAVAGYPNARYKSYSSLEEATAAYRGDPQDQMALFRAMASRPRESVNYSEIPEISKNAIAVDAACSRNPGPVEYQGVDVASGKRIFHVGPMQGGSNNLGEFLALVHALALLEQRRRPDVVIYSDSRTAMSWVRNKQVRTNIIPTAANAEILSLVDRALRWLHTHTPQNRIIKWDTERWGEIPADFGRK